MGAVVPSMLVSSLLVVGTRSAGWVVLQVEAEEAATGGSYPGGVLAGGGFLRFSICVHFGVVFAGVFVAHVLVRRPRVGIILVTHFAH